MEITLHPGVTLRCVTDKKFKQGCLSLQFLRPLKQGETALGTLLPAVLLRGCEKYPSIEALTARQDELYGSYIGALSRKIRDTYATGFFLRFLDDRYTFDGESVLVPMAEFLSQILFYPLMENGLLLSEFVESEKENLVDAILSRDNDKAGYAMRQLISHMAGADGMGIPRLGTVEEAEAITPESLTEYYHTLLKTSPIALFYVGAEEPERVAALLSPIFAGQRQLVEIPGHKPFCGNEPGEYTESEPIAQSHLCLGFTSSIDSEHPLYAAMLVGNSLYGGGMTSKLFDVVREKMSLCYSIGSTYVAAKGVVLVSAGIDAAQRQQAENEILRQMALMQAGNISQGELRSAKESLLSSLRGLTDSPSAMENFFSACCIEKMDADLGRRMAAIASVTEADVAEAFSHLQLHTKYFLQGDGE